MKAKQEHRAPRLAEYSVVYKFIPNQPDVDRIISRSRKQIVVNLAAKKGAKITKLLP